MPEIKKGLFTERKRGRNLSLAKTFDEQNSGKTSSTLTADPKAGAAPQKYQLNHVNMLDDQGLAGLLAKRLHTNFSIEEQDQRVIRQKAEFYRLDFFNAVMAGGKKDDKHRAGEGHRLPITTHF